MALPIEIEIGLIRAAGEGIITFDQQEKLIRYLLNLPTLSASPEQSEQLSFETKMHIDMVVGRLVAQMSDAEIARLIADIQKRPETAISPETRYALQVFAGYLADAGR